MIFSGEDTTSNGPSPVRGLVWAFGFCALFSGLLFSWFLTYGSFRFIVAEPFGDFYDYQAQSLLAGRLDVPPEAIGNEAFVFGGKTYGYFGPTPALFRIPFVAGGVLFGQLSRSLMILYFGVMLLAVFDLTRLAAKLQGGPTAEPRAWTVVCMLLSVGIGSTVLMLGSRSFVYHEAILCGIAFALASCSCSVRWLSFQGSSWWIGSLVLGLLAVHSRPPCGLFALTFSAAASFAKLCRSLGLDRDFRGAWRFPRFERGWRVPVLVAALSAAGVSSFNLLGYLKFKTWEGCPLRYSIPYTPERLKVVGYQQFHLVNIPHNIDAYFTGRHFSLKPTFPFFENHDPSLSVAKGAFVEPGKPIAIPYMMPSLTLFAFFGIFVVARGSRDLRQVALLCWLAVVPMAIALFAAVAVSQRYTGDFVPFLALASAFGLCSFPARVQVSRLFRAGCFAAVGLSIFINLLITFHYQGTRKWGVPDYVPVRYEEIRKSVDGFLG